MFSNLFDSIFEDAYTPRETVCGYRQPPQKQRRQPQQYYNPYYDVQDPYAAYYQVPHGYNQRRDEYPSAREEQMARAAQLQRERQRVASAHSGYQRPQKEVQQVQSKPAPQKKEQPQTAYKVPVKAAPKPQLLQTDQPSEDSHECKITNRESVDAPEVAFKTYRSNAVVQRNQQTLVALDAESQKYLAHGSNAALIVIPAHDSDAVNLQATGKGVLQISFTSAGRTRQLSYQLPSYYDRSEIRAHRDDFGVSITVPLYSAPEEDVMVIQVQ
ncbi:Hsp20/alpha_crystallin family protein [Hexamita inflata]|uniref:Hsp20/alpha crystallin family protein n=1 Tax=Hexamita inflata TaxID=28002 RepID=A0AA86QY24_9EUKA|nr:Hsp20/alpha crystallin family protein [Hexamita inflata]